MGTLGIYFSAIGSYEYIVWQQKRTHLATFARAGYGGYVWLAATGGGLSGVLTGAGKSHFEAALGVSYMMEKDKKQLPLSARI